MLHLPGGVELRLLHWSGGVSFQAMGMGLISSNNLQRLIAASGGDSVRSAAQGPNGAGGGGSVVFSGAPLQPSETSARHNISAVAAGQAAAAAAAQQRLRVNTNNSGARGVSAPPSAQQPMSPLSSERSPGAAAGMMGALFGARPGGATVAPLPASAAASAFTAGIPAAAAAGSTHSPKVMFEGALRTSDASFDGTDAPALSLENADQGSSRRVMGARASSSEAFSREGSEEYLQPLVRPPWANPAALQKTPEVRLLQLHSAAVLLSRALCDSASSN